MAKWFDTLQQQKEAVRQAVNAVETIDDIPEDALPDHGWTLTLNIKKITPRIAVDGTTYYWLMVKDKVGHCFSIVVWRKQFDDLGPLEEGDTRQLTVKVPRGDYTAWNLM